MATHTLSHDEYENLLRQAREAREETAALRKELTEAREQALNIGFHNGTALVFLARSAIKVVQFAVANMPPEVTKHWPADDLTKFASNLEALPDYSERDRDFALELRNFARDAARADQARAST